MISSALTPVRPNAATATPAAAAGSSNASPSAIMEPSMRYGVHCRLTAQNMVTSEKTAVRATAVRSMNP